MVAPISKFIWGQTMDVRCKGAKAPEHWGGGVWGRCTLPSVGVWR